jgi:hypothetical protein
MQFNIISIAGGLGNQMFQYAFYLSLKNKNKFTFFWVAPYKRHNGFELEKIFKIKYSFFGNSILKVLKFSSRYIGEKNVDLESGKFSFFSSNKPIIYHSGYWQSEKYFYNIQHLIRKNYFFNEKILNGKSIEILNRINLDLSVSIHIRRGDYYSDLGACELLGNICTLNYYTNAINFLINSLPNKISFFIFSDDIEWVRNNFSNLNFNYIDWNGGEYSWIDMFLMSKCKHNVIANSSFSWWGAWLNKNPNKIVVAPTKWFNHHDVLDIIPDNWIKMSV